MGPLTAPQVIAVYPRGTTMDEARDRENAEREAAALATAAGRVPEGANYPGGPHMLEEIVVQARSWAPWLLIALALGLALWGDAIRARISK